MERVFAKYACFYDKLYSDKDYTTECNYLSRLFKKYSDIKIKSILDLGCGTGGHALIFARRNYCVTGLDRSTTMLNFARAKAKESGMSINFYKRDIRKFDLKKRYDAIIAMFAVMGYQTKTKDFLSTLKCVRRHLRPGGIFVFDVWSGPAVLAQRLGNKIKVVNTVEGKIVRMSYSKLDLRNNLVEVGFDVRRMCGDRVVERIKETHLMRFFFIPEIEYLAKAAGFKTNIIYTFLTKRRNITKRDWNLCIVLR